MTHGKPLVILYPNNALTVVYYPLLKREGEGCVTYL